MEAIDIRLSVETINLIPPRRIFLQPDSPIPLLARELFIRLLERALRYRNKEFSLEDARNELSGQVYAFKDHEEYAKIRKAIGIGVRQQLCRVVTSDQWALDLALTNPERYLEKLSQLLKQSGIEDYF